MPKLNLQSSDDLAETKNFTIFLYGENRSGKTHFCGTWPNPLFFVPKGAANEMRTLSADGFPVILFGDMEDCRNQVNEVGKLLLRNKPVGPYVPRTIIVDNLTSAITFWEEEMKAGIKAKLDWEDWGKLKSQITGMFTALHKFPDQHIIWIAHSKIQTVTSEGANGKKEQTNVGSFTLPGESKNLIPSHCDLMLYAEQVSRGPKGPAWYIHAKKKGIWPAGSRVNVDPSKPLSKIGPDPHYDDIAPYLGLPSLEEEEGE